VTIIILLGGGALGAQLASKATGVSAPFFGVWGASKLLFLSLVDIDLYIRDLTKRN